MKHELYEMVYVPEELSQAVQTGIQTGRTIRRKRRRRSILTVCGSMAAVCALFVTFCAANPALASNIPFIGKIFEKVEGSFAYQGDFSEHSTHLAQTLPEKETVEPEITDEITGPNTLQQLEALYGDTNQNITVTPEKVFCDGISLYLGLRLTTADEEGFGFEEISISHQMELRGSVFISGAEQTFHTMM